MAKKPNLGGRPTKYSEEMVNQILELAMNGKTDLQICKKLGIAVATLFEWKAKYPGFSEALKKAKEVSDEEVEATLRMKAMGYKKKVAKFWYDKDIQDVVTHVYMEYFPPDTTAQIFWLKNRQPKKWRDRVDLNHSGEIDGPQVIITLPDNERASKDAK